MSQQKRPTPKGSVPPRGGKGRPPRPVSRPPVTGSRPKPRTAEAAASPPMDRRSQNWERRRVQRRNRNLAIGGVALVVVVVAALIIVKAVGGGGSGGTKPVPAAVLSEVTGIPSSDLVAAATAAGSKGASGSSVSPPTGIKGPPALGGAHPQILYIGAEYCPYCAAERWPLVMALSKFGTFTGLRATTSSSSDVNANTPTFSFVDAHYSSPYLTLTTREIENRLEQTLQKPTKAQEALINRYDNPPYVSSQSKGSIPFILFGDRYLVSGAEYDASALSGKSITDAASILTTPASTSAAAASKLGAVSLAAQATAGHLMGAICTITNDKPSVCASVPASLKGTGTASQGKTSKAG